MSKTPIVIFMHIPKTAGVTLKTILRNHYKPSETYTDYTHVHKKGDKNDCIQCIIGHNPFGIHHHDLSRPFTYITILRNPIDRVISHYYYLCNIQNIDMSLQNFLNSTSNKFKTENMQTRYVSGVSQPPNQATLQKAKENIRTKFSVVGITEMFGESLALMKHTFKWTDVSYEILNKNRKKPPKSEVPAHIVQQIAEMNELDMQLYHWAKNNLNIRIKTLKKDGVI